MARLDRVAWSNTCKDVRELERIPPDVRDGIHRAHCTEIAARFGYTMADVRSTQEWADDGGYL